MWTIKDVEVWLTSTNITWVHDGEYGVSRKLDVDVNSEWMVVTASLSYMGKELCIKRLTLERAVDNIYFLDGEGMEQAFKRAMVEGHDY